MTAREGSITLRVMTAFTFQRHVIAGNDVLRWYFQHFLAQRNAHHLIEGTKHKNDPGTFGRRQNAAQAEDDRSFILPENFDGIDQINRNNQNNDQAGNANTHH